MESVNKVYFDKKISYVIKGLAIVMMFVHHFFGFPKWWCNGVDYPYFVENDAIPVVSCKLCVSIFAFLTGYFYFFKENYSFKYSLKKIIHFLIAYWIVLILLAILAILLVNYNYSIIDFLLEMFALKRPTMVFCWYVYFYVIVMLLLPIFSKFISKNVYLDILLSTLFVFIFTVIKTKTEISSFIELPFIGFIFAKYGLFERIEAINKKLIKNKYVEVFFCLILLIILPLSRIYISNLVFYIDYLTFLPYLEINLDIIRAPLFIYVIVNIDKCTNLSLIKNILSKIGEHSLLMWFVSCCFFNNSAVVLQPYLYFLKNPILVTVWGLMICYVVSLPINKIVNYLQNLTNKKIFKDI